MVRILNEKNIQKISNIVFRILKTQELFTRIIEVDNPGVMPCVYVMWHAHQFCIHGLPHRAATNVLISRSKDGEVIADVVEKWGFKTIRGSKGKKGAIEASMQMISALKNGENCAMMVDGPRGPAKIAKDGAIKIAKMAGVPVVPVYWYSKNLINIYGEPIYISPDGDEEEARQKLQQSLEELEQKAPKAFDEVYKFGIWRRKK